MNIIVARSDSQQCRKEARKCSLYRSQQTLRDGALAGSKRWINTPRGDVGGLTCSLSGTYGAPWGLYGEPWATCSDGLLHPTHTHLVFAVAYGKAHGERGRGRRRVVGC